MSELEGRNAVEQERIAWMTPELVVHGQVEELTRGAGGTFPDVGGNNSCLG